MPVLKVSYFICDVGTDSFLFNVIFIKSNSFYELKQYGFYEVK